MGTASEQQGITVAEYLEKEKINESKHEYVNGLVYARGGVSCGHNIIAMNLATALHSHLRGGPCQTFMADMKVHLQLRGDELFYYPDVMVGCDPSDRAQYYLERPLFIAEVLSPASERIDRREKWLAYTHLDSLAAYLILEQEHSHALLYRRTANWMTESLGMGDRLILPELECAACKAEAECMHGRQSQPECASKEAKARLASHLRGTECYRDCLCTGVATRSAPKRKR